MSLIRLIKKLVLILVSINPPMVLESNNPYPSIVEHRTLGTSDSGNRGILGTKVIDSLQRVKKNVSTYTQVVI